MRMCSVLCGELNGKEIQKREEICVHIGDSFHCGKEIQKRGEMCVHIGDSFHCTVESNTTLLDNYTSIKKKKRNQGFSWWSSG